MALSGRLQANLKNNPFLLALLGGVNFISRHYVYRYKLDIQCLRFADTSCLGFVQLWGASEGGLVLWQRPDKVAN